MVCLQGIFPHENASKDAEVAKYLAIVCFLGGAHVIDYTTGSEIGDPHHDSRPHQVGVDNPHHNSSQEYINGNDNQIKKKDEKIDTAVWISPQDFFI